MNENNRFQINLAGWVAIVVGFSTSGTDASLICFGFAGLLFAITALNPSVARGTASRAFEWIWGFVNFGIAGALAWETLFSTLPASNTMLGQSIASILFALTGLMYFVMAMKPPITDVEMAQIEDDGEEAENDVARGSEENEGPSSNSN